MRAFKSFRIKLPSGERYWTVVDGNSSPCPRRGRLASSPPHRPRLRWIDDRVVCRRTGAVFRVVCLEHRREPTEAAYVDVTC